MIFLKDALKLFIFYGGRRQTAEFLRMSILLMVTIFPVLITEGLGRRLISMSALPEIFFIRDSIDLGGMAITTTSLEYY